jgi:glc operon protein GlcG
MHKVSLYAAALLSGFMLVAPLKGQAPAPTPAPAPLPDAIPFDIPYGTPISLERAKQVAEAAMAEAKRRNWKMAIAVVDPAGDLVYFVKMDGTMYASTKIAEHKARSAAIFRRPTKVFFDAMESGHPYIATLDGMIGAEGGLPINEGGKIIGGIGTSGGTGAQDATVSKAGADSVK